MRQRLFQKNALGFWSLNMKLLGAAPRSAHPRIDKRVVAARRAKVKLGVVARRLAAHETIGCRGNKCKAVKEMQPAKKAVEILPLLIAEKMRPIVVKEAAETLTAPTRGRKPNLLKSVLDEAGAITDKETDLNRDEVLTTNMIISRRVPGPEGPSHA